MFAVMMYVLVYLGIGYMISYICAGKKWLLVETATQAGWMVFIWPIWLCGLLLAEIIADGIHVFSVPLNRALHRDRIEFLNSSIPNLYEKLEEDHNNGLSTFNIRHNIELLEKERDDLIAECSIFGAPKPKEKRVKPETF